MVLGRLRNVPVGQESGDLLCRNRTWRLREELRQKGKTYKGTQKRYARGDLLSILEQFTSYVIYISARCTVRVAARYSKSNLKVRTQAIRSAQEAPRSTETSGKGLARGDDSDGKGQLDGLDARENGRSEGRARTKKGTGWFGMGPPVCKCASDIRGPRVVQVDGEAHLIPHTTVVPSKICDSGAPVLQRLTGVSRVASYCGGILHGTTSPRANHLYLSTMANRGAHYCSYHSTFYGSPPPPYAPATPTYVPNPTSP